MEFSRNLSVLSSFELIYIEGGAPGTGTSLEYDVSWVIGRTLRFVADGLSGKYAGSDSVVLG